MLSWGFPGGSAVENPPANAGDEGSILGQEDPFEAEMRTCSSILVWEIPWTEEPGGLQSIGAKRDMTEYTRACAELCAFYLLCHFIITKSL